MPKGFQRVATSRRVGQIRRVSAGSAGRRVAPGLSGLSRVGRGGVASPADVCCDSAAGGLDHDGFIFCVELDLNRALLWSRFFEFGAQRWSTSQWLWKVS
jgi:hypothetical protein